MKATILLPSMRFATLGMVLRSFIAGAAEMPLEILVIVTAEEAQDLPRLPWYARACVAPSAIDQHPAHAKVNHVLDTEPIDGDRHLMFWSDDNLLPVPFWSQVRAHSDAAMVIASMDRGQVPSFHPATPLIAAPDNVRPGFISGDQALVRRDALGDLRLPCTPMGDGELLTELFARHREQTVFLPDVWLPFNALQPGRWRGDALTTLLGRSSCADL